MNDTMPVILAAGRGTRMHSGLAKALHELGGVPLVEHVMRAATQAGLGRPLVVVGYQGDRVEELLEGKAEFITQPELRGTGDAVMRALEAISAEVTEIVVLVADCPLIPHELLTDLVAHHRKSRSAATIVTTTMQDPKGYGRIVRDESGNVQNVIEDKDADDTVRAITEINTGIGIWNVHLLQKVLPTLPWHDEERYLPEALGSFLAIGESVSTLYYPRSSLVMGINTRRELSQAEAILRQTTLDRLFDQGVTIVDPASTYVDADVEVGQDTVIYPMTFLRGKTKIGRECHIGPMATIVASRIGDGVTIDRSVIEQSALASRCRVGPFSHLRAGTYLDHNVKIGNFVELKNARVGIGSKAGHHSYLGDATIGGRVNIGAGTVIVNYDGESKHPTFIGDEAFIGCNVNLVAPVEIGAGAYVAAGSTVTQNVPPGGLAIARSRQEVKPGWAHKRRPRVPDGGNRP